MTFQINKMMLFGLILVLSAIVPASAQKSKDSRGTGRERHEPLVVPIGPRYVGSGGDGSGSERGGHGSDRNDDPSGLRHGSGTDSTVSGSSAAGGGVAGNQTQAFINDILKPGGFPQKVLAGNGYVPISIKEDLSQFAQPRVGLGSDMFLMKTPDRNGHHYITFNYLGHNLNLEQIWSRVTQTPDIFLPFNQVQGLGGRAITVGNQYDLIMGGAPHAPPHVSSVVVTNVTPHYFTFGTLIGRHWLRGTATHGIVKDRTGAVWLFQEGVGVSREPRAWQFTNYVLADNLWKMMSDNIKEQIINTPQTTRRGWRRRERSFRNSTN
jgi:hypothetical protein